MLDPDLQKISVREDFWKLYLFHIVFVTKG